MDNFTVINCLLNAALALIAISGNTLVLTAILTTPALRSASTVFLGSLAVSDLLVGLVVQPVFIVLVLKRGPELTHAVAIVSVLSCGVSICTMTAISVDRFLALHYHMRYPNLMTEKRAIWTATSLWFFMILASCLLYLWKVSYARLVLSTGIAICLLITFFLYIRIYQIVRRHQLQIQFQQQAVQSVSAEHNLNMARRKRSAINTFIYYMCMIVCYFPQFTSMLVLAIYPGMYTNKWDLMSTVVFMNSSINPILYCWRLGELRTAVLKILRHLLRKQTEEN